MHCYDYFCDGDADFRGATQWTLNGWIENVPTCKDHTLCPFCGKVMEVSPISLRIECFLHGEPNLSSNS